MRRGATVSADQLPLPRLYSATGRACRRKWRYIKYTPLPFTDTNTVKGCYYSPQVLFQCHHPTLWSFMNGLNKDVQMQKTMFLQGVSGAQS